jgi:hypothetical protein
MTWQTERPLRPPPGVHLIDAICISADRRERQQAAQPEMLQQMMAMLAKMQAQQLQILAALVARMDDKPKPDKNLSDLRSEAKAK